MINCPLSVVLCVIAHPDDEAFGPGGTIAALFKSHTVYSICVTDGNDPETTKDLRRIRRKDGNWFVLILEKPTKREHFLVWKR